MTATSADYTADLQLFIAGEWRGGEGRDARPVVDPATAGTIAELPVATAADLDEALAAAARGWPAWRAKTPDERGALMHKVAGLIRERVDHIATLLTLEQGKPIAQARGEVLSAAGLFDYFAEQGKRIEGRVVQRPAGERAMVLKQPVGPVAAFSPWNFPVNLMAKKIAPALAAGCVVIAKAPEETPGCTGALMRCIADAGIPGDAAQLVYGNPDMISRHLLGSPVIRKVSFTGSTAVGKHLMKLAADHVQRITMELGGHAPVLIFDDCDLEATLDRVVAQKFRNAGQVCVSPTRFYVQAGIYDAFVRGFAERTKRVRVGHGLDPDTQMGPLANARRAPALQAMIADATAKGARVIAGGEAMGEGYFFQPTALADVPIEAEAMVNEPFGPMALMRSFDTEEDAIEQANRLPYGLAAFAFTENGRRINRVADGIESGMVGINSFVISAHDLPFGGVKQSGFGSESGPEGLDGYLVTKAVHIC
ncbi:MAG: NAD-dependent succinate-semialdehyde dehydrogenase [Sphingopyxis granuli]|uniref:NAD-dependent succinate-semialdehyde dehydrogenase n=1 Tax=unclassified Sphingopyxis TaxID=2614943 RepID=UPI0008695D84|nr:MULTISPECIES: NAD-dependent succinate-semialdehyde dehydrogenase [unclassified Sphingopyxis]AVA14390.1 NAD-dependent succinate-semialdehyde dehydrogenase [Sphingopyxis sp. MG]ODU27407.1 MAG: NAD-dependent succinate-semialdehyde dehydrogenase [Sphingopyxis sp. SCN 67-31]